MAKKKKNKTAELFQKSIEVKSYIKNQIREGKAIDENELKGFKLAQPL